ncbi:MAG: Txe/YoeB family addiction module toxin [Muribaculaceae bacterium]|nr:Txe/YoeB family addiction module toxin [Muribaculaceae bacterium]
MRYRIVLTKQAVEDYRFWKSTGNKGILNKITRLLEDMSEHPYVGIGKPEALKYELAGFWSRRINSEHRIVYRVIEDVVEIDVLAMRYHYKK